MTYGIQWINYDGPFDSAWWEDVWAPVTDGVLRFDTEDDANAYIAAWLKVAQEQKFLAWENAERNLKNSQRWRDYEAQVAALAAAGLPTNGLAKPSHGVHKPVMDDTPSTNNYRVVPDAEMDHPIDAWFAEQMEKNA